MVKVPEAPAADAGSNFTVIVAVPLGVSVTFVPPLALNPLPWVETPEIVTFAVPESVNTTDCETVVATVTLPNPTDVLLGVSVDCGCVCELVGATAVADSGI